MLEWLDSRQPLKSATLMQTSALSPVANAASASSVRGGSLTTVVAKCSTSFLRLNLCDLEGLVVGKMPSRYKVCFVFWSDERGSGASSLIKRCKTKLLLT